MANRQLVQLAWRPENATRGQTLQSTRPQEYTTRAKRPKTEIFAENNRLRNIDNFLVDVRAATA